MDHTPTGAELRDASVKAVIAADTAPHRNIRADIEAALDQLAATGAPFSADDIRDRVDDTRMPPLLLPAVVRVAAQQGRIQPVGWAVSRRPIRHHGPVRMWVGVTSDQEGTAA